MAILFTQLLVITTFSPFSLPFLKKTFVGKEFLQNWNVLTNVSIFSSLVTINSNDTAPVRLCVYIMKTLKLCFSMFEVFSHLWINKNKFFRATFLNIVKWIEEWHNIPWSSKTGSVVKEVKVGRGDLTP